MLFGHGDDGFAAADAQPNNHYDCREAFSVGTLSAIMMT